MRIEEALAQKKEEAIMQGALVLENILTGLMAAGSVIGTLIIMLTVFIK
jgi:hypothetical protein